MVVIDKMFNKGFCWIEGENVAVRGYAYIENEYYESCNLADYIVKNSIFETQDIQDFVSNISGSFAIIYEDQATSILCTDIVRTFPIFYTILNDQILISNSCKELAKYRNFQIDQKSLLEFRKAGYVTDNRTIYKDVFQVEAGSIVIWHNESLKNIKYFSYLTNCYYGESFSALSNRLESILDGVSNRLVKSLKGKTAVIPLSGGYDSRLVASLLKKKNYSDVICFSYGRGDSFEAAISKQVAERLGYKWIFIEYSDELLKETINSDQWDEYLEFGFNGTSVSCIQDFFAVKELKDKYLIPNNSIFIPGHTGDFFAGTHTLGAKDGFSTKKEIDKKVYGHHFILDGDKYKYKEIDIINEEQAVKYYAHSIIENWDIENRQAKFIINANRVYEYFEYEHRVPLWDRELAGFFKKVPLSYKNRDNNQGYIEDKNLYDHTIMRYFLDFTVDFKKYHPKNKNNTGKMNLLIKHILRRVLPKEFYGRLSKLYLKILKYDAINDPDNFERMAFFLSSNLREYININSIIIMKIVQRLM